MRSTALLLSLALGGAPAVSRQAFAAGTTARQPKADLDLNADFDEAEPSLPSEGSEAAPGKPSRAWIYWTAAAGTLAAAGGFGWYWRSRTDATRIVREEVVFTDER